MSLKIQENVLLKDLTTFRIGGCARYFALVKNEDDLREAFSFAKSRKLPVFTLGGGSNLLISDNGFAGLVIKNEIRGTKFIDQGNGRVVLDIGSGENFDELVALSVSRNLSGLENLSGIPGTVGGAAVQNAGAYGAELKDRLLSVTGLNISNGKKFSLSKDDCHYAYRQSVFKKNKKLFITSITIELKKEGTPKLDYASLKERFSDGEKLSILAVREAVIKIRQEKLPDWHKLGTAGSFFKNPIISLEKYNQLKEKYPDLPNFPESKAKVKVPLAWILDHVCGLKGYRLDEVGLYEKQPLAIVNFGTASAKDIVDLSEKIKKIVKEKTGIDIVEEVELLK